MRSANIISVTLPEWSVRLARIASCVVIAQVVAASTCAEPDQPIISNIDIQEQAVDFSRLHDVDYRGTLPFGEKLIHAFDTILAFRNCPDRLDLPYDLNTVTFHFSYPDWHSPHKVQYVYLLEGRDNMWNEPSEEPFVVLRDLSPGQYTLLVKARDGSANWSLPAKFSIDIGKPWWSNWWVKGSLALVLVGLLFLFLRNRERRKSEFHEMQQLLEAYRTTPKLSFEGIERREQNEVEDGFLRLINKTLEEHLSDENFGIAELCELLNISRAQLHRKLKKQTGLSTSHYIRFLRLQMARELLRDQSLNVSEVAFSVGFSNAAYFSKVFKSKYGISPSEAREQL